MLKCRVILLLILLAGCHTPPRDSAAKSKATLDAIEEARQAAYSRYLDCKVYSEVQFNNELAVEGRPIPGKKGQYTEKAPGSFDKLKQQENFDDSECRKVYEAELGLIQSRAQQQEQPSK